MSLQQFLADSRQIRGWQKKFIQVSLYILGPAQIKFYWLAQY